MRITSRLLALPASLLVLVLSSSTPSFAGNDQRYETPADTKQSLGGLPHRKREFEAVQSHLRAGHTPVVVKKMTEDESEMFFPEYWGFREEVDQFAVLGTGPSDVASGWSIRQEFEEEDTRATLNSSAALSMRPPFLVRATHETSLSRRDIRTLTSRHIKGNKDAAAEALALLEKRQVVCPAGTLSCSNMPILCCAAGENCVTITDTSGGIGSIGCCPVGFTCQGPIHCVGGNVPCNSDIGGGCCTPGDVCASIGCIPSAQVSTAVTSKTVVATSSQIPIPSTNLIIVTTVVTPSLPSLLASTSTLTLTASHSSQPATTTSTATAIVISSPSTTGTTSPSAPARGSNTATTAQMATSSAAPTSSATDSSCPTGFYVCSAYYPGGCCRPGRDCSTAGNCPSTAYTTLVSSGVTIVVPLTGAATSVASGTCATGWSSCAATDGGNCCPSGWACGQESCTSTGPTATQTEAKEGVLVNGGGKLMTMPSRLLEGVVLSWELFLLLLV